MICFVCKKEIEKLSGGVTPMITVNMASAERNDVSVPLIFCHTNCFCNSAGKEWADTMFKEAERYIVR